MEYRWDDAAAAKLTDELEQLIYISNLVGADTTLTQPGGGNSSVKRRETDFAGRPVEVLRVKGSGTDMRTIARPGFCGLRVTDLEFLRRRDQMTDEEMMDFMRACMLDAREPAPSVETPLHSVLPYRFILHTHDFATQALTDTRRPEALVGEALGKEAAYVDYVRPGFPLARQVSQLGPMPAEARGLVLGKHGLIAWGDTAKACYDNLHRLITRAEEFVAGKRGTKPFVEVRPPSAANHRERARALLPSLRARLAGERGVILHYDDSPDALGFVSDPRLGELAPRGMSTPEHILRCGRVPLVVDGELEPALARWQAEYRAAFERHKPAAQMLEPLPKVVLLPGLGLVTAMKDKANAVVGNLCYRHVMRVMDAAEALGGFHFLDEKDGLEFEYWPLELVKLKAAEKELSRQVAVVTGAAGGIGKAIAERFAAEGAHLVLTDIAAEALAQTAAGIRASCKDPHRVIAVEVDARDAARTAAAFTEAVMAFGGVDILVCNAGFVEAGPLDTMTEESWDKQYDINVKGYFLAAREAIRLMKLQKRGAIVFNASKGAFAPTADNAIYASSKAAVAALARNLATELGPHGIRVNYFNADFVDTPLMRKIIAERAAMKNVSVDKQTEEYRKRNLMGVGPMPANAVAEAALFLASPRSRFTTGGVLTIDGGIKEAMPR